MFQLSKVLLILSFFITFLAQGMFTEEDVKKIFFDELVAFVDKSEDQEEFFKRYLGKRLSCLYTVKYLFQSDSKWYKSGLPSRLIIIENFWSETCEETKKKFFTFESRMRLEKMQNYKTFILACHSCMTIVDAKDRLLLCLQEIDAWEKYFLFTETKKVYNVYFRFK